MRIPLIAAAALVACGGSSGAPDGDGSPDAVDGIAYRVRVLDVPAGLTFRVDGLEINPYEVVYPDLASFEAARFDVELLDGDLVLDTWPITPEPEECRDEVPTGEVIRASEALCAAPNGELRWASVSVNFVAEGCVADGDCSARCAPTFEAHCADAKCGVSRPALDRPWSRVECVAAGAVPVGEACTWTARDDGRFVDDCVRDALCVDGTCVELCETGAPIAGFPPEMQACASAIR